MKQVMTFLIALLFCGCSHDRSEQGSGNNDHTKSSMKAFPGINASTAETTQTSQFDTRWQELLMANPHELSPWTDYVRDYMQSQETDANHLADVWVRISERFPNQPEVQTQAARALRLVGQSSTSLARLNKQALMLIEPVELADLYLETGAYPQAASILEELGLTSAAGYQPLLDKMFREVLSQAPNESEQYAHQIQLAGLTFSFLDNWNLASEIWTAYLDRVARIRRLADLRIMKRLAPAEPAFSRAIEDIENLSVPFAAFNPLAPNRGLNSSQEHRNDLQIYQKHCANCHGLNGDGQGSASRFLFPPARSFVSESIRYISSLNQEATESDLRQTIINGLAGTSMPAFNKLSELELDRIIRQIRRFHALGSNASRTKSIDIEPAPLQNWATDATPFIEDGKAQFVRFGCAACHRSTRDQEQRVFVDSMGRTLTVRDFLTDPLRKGNSAQEVYNRIVCGIPGTPHPQLIVNESDIRPLVFYVCSLLPSKYPVTTNHSRRLMVSGISR